MSQAITVVKLGGTEGVDFSAICTDAAELLTQGKKLVFVHGGSAEANALGEAIGSLPKFITSPSLMNISAVAPAGAVSRPSWKTNSRLSRSYTSMNAPPPMPED